MKTHLGSFDTVQCISGGGGGLGVGLGIYLRPREGGNNVSVYCEATVIQFVGPGPVPT